MAASGRRRRYGIAWILLAPDRLPDFQVDLSASNSGCADGVCRLGLADLFITAARKLSISLQFGLRSPRRRIGDVVAPRHGRERSTMEGAGRRRMKAAVYRRYGPPEVVEI